MIVHPASLEDGRTVWRVDGEAGDRDLPRDSLWVGGRLRSIPASLEALWLALVLGPFARRLVVPGSIDETLARNLDALIGTRIVGDVEDAGAERHSGDYGATLIRDSFDEHLAARESGPSTFPIAVQHDPEGVQAIPCGFRIVSNGGVYRRYLHPLDRVGELAASVMAAPVLGIGDMTAFLCCEELGGLDLRLLGEVMSSAGIRLDLPLAKTGVKELGRLAKDHPSPESAFGVLYARYRMFPAVIVDIYEDLKPGLVAAGAGRRASVQVAEHLALRAAQPGRG